MATRRYTIPSIPEASTHYASNLNDQEFARIEPHVAQKEGSGKRRFGARRPSGSLPTRG
jgi:hypothetical protein